MSQERILNESDRDTLINLLLHSQQSRRRETLCSNIGIDPKRLSFIRDSSDSDFFLLLITRLNEIDEQEALCKLCYKELFPVFHHGTHAHILSDIAARLDCHQKLLLFFNELLLFIYQSTPRLYFIDWYAWVSCFRSVF